MKKSNVVRLAMVFGFLALSACSGYKSASIAEPAGQGNSPSPSPKPTPGTPEQVQLAWGANAGEQTGFNVLQSTDNKTFTIAQTVTEPARAATVSVSAGTTYYFQIQAFNQAGNSPTTTAITVNVP